MAERPETERRAISLVSGLDSCIMTALLVREQGEVTPLFVRAGLKWESAELSALRDFFEALGHPGIRPLVETEIGAGTLYGSHWSTGGEPVPDAFAPDQAFYLPGRNLLLLSVAATYGAINEIPRIAIGILASNPFPDARPEFLRNFEAAAGSALDMEITVLTPLAQMHKIDLIKAGADFPVELSLSCADPFNGGHCGVCGKCGERRRGFIEAGVVDKTLYHELPPL